MQFKPPATLHLRAQDPEAPAAENDMRLTQQLGLMLDCLADSCPAVREAAVTGVCSCLHRFWEIIPAATSAKMLQDMTGGLGAASAPSPYPQGRPAHGQLRSQLDSSGALVASSFAPNK